MTTIRVLERKNLGDYQHRECEITTVIEDGANEAEAINSLIRRVRWHLGRPEAEKTYQQWERALAIGELSDDETTKGRRYIANFDKAKAEIEG